MIQVVVAPLYFRFAALVLDECGSQGRSGCDCTRDAVVMPPSKPSRQNSFHPTVHFNSGVPTFC